MHGVSGAFSFRGGGSQVQQVQAHQQANAKEALKVVGDVVKGKVSAEEGMKKLVGLVVDAAKAQESLAPAKDTFESAPAAKPAVDLGADTGAKKAAFLEKGGGGAKRGIASGTN